MSDPSLIVAGVRVYVSGGSLTVAQLEHQSRSRREIIVLFPVLFPSPITTLPVTRIGKMASWGAPITSVTIPCHVQILCSWRFSRCKLLLSISFETDSELTRIESNAFCDYSSLASITIPRHVQIVCLWRFSRYRVSHVKWSTGESHD
jgi:hypothetical protein